MSDIQRNLLIINSIDKTSGTSDNFQYSLGDVSLDINSIALKQASIPHTYTNVDENNNDLQVEVGTEFTLTSTAELNYNVNGVSEIPINPGTYTLNSLISSINASNTFCEFEYDDITNRVTSTIITGGITGFGVNFLTGGTPAVLSLLGFTLPFNIPAGIGNNVVAPNPPTYVDNSLYTLEIPSGQYTIAELLVQVGIQMDLIFVSPGSYGLNGNGKVVIDSLGLDNWIFRESNIPHLLGYEPRDMTFNTLQTATGLPDMYGTRNLYISSRVLANGYNALQSDGDKTSILGCIPVCSVFGGIDKWQQNYLVKKDYPQPINVNSFDIQILDDTGKVVDLQGAEIVLVFEVWVRTKL